jgi:hypothetical protein
MKPDHARPDTAVGRLYALLLLLLALLTALAAVALWPR